jgi:nucleolar protein 56
MDVRKRALEKIRKQLKEKKAKRDTLIVKSMDTLDALNKTINMLYEKLGNWYSLYFPELWREIDDLEKYVRMIAEYGFKEEYPGRYRKLAEKSIGADFEKDDVEEMIELAKTIHKLIKYRNSLEKYVKELVKKVAPNLAEVCGEKLAARLISEAGSLEKLAEFPASTVQVLGAEKALFAHLTKKVPPPKHGVIFQHPLVRKAPKKLRGKISRKLANKINLAAKLDYFGGENKGKELREELEKEVKSILGK